MNKSNHITPAVIPGLAEMLTDCSIDRVMAIDKEWHIIAWNRTSELVSGIAKDDVMGRKLLDVFPRFAQDKEMMTAIDLALSGMKSFVPAHKDLFNRQHYENHFIPLKTTDGDLIGVMHIMHDVAHRIKAEQELHRLNIALKKKYEQLERTSDELSTFTYITSHNIKEPLRQVYSSIELLIRAEAKALSDGGRANLRRMQSSLTRMNLLLDDMLVLSRINNLAEEGTLVDFNEVLRGAISNLGDKISNNRVEIEAIELPAVTGHRDMLQDLCVYLVSNAIRFRKPAETLHIKVNNCLVSFPANETDLIPERIYQKITFTDNGTGFQQEDAESIFMMADKSPQKPAGVGAGLAICRKVMLAHDGFIEAEGWPGKGAAFHCYFPIISGE
jgi:PAS domain S-box-containing protein